MHEIRHMEFSTRKSMNTIQKECDKVCKECGEYHHACDPIRFFDKVMKNYDEAYRFIEERDSGWYDALAVKFKDGRSVKWLVKFEYHV